VKFALVNNKKIEPTKGVTGVCPICGSKVIARCGEIKTHHWAHKNKCTDRWWENETEWHRNWKNQFPKEWQEIVHFDDTGEKHIADVKTSENWVVEFQHSSIKSEERTSRNEFYNQSGNLIWVVDGTRRKTDIKQFENEREFGCEICKDPPLVQVFSESRLLKEWGDSPSFVFLDFGGFEQEYLQCICTVHNGKNFITKVTKKRFVELLNGKKFGVNVMNRILEPLEEAEIQQEIKNKEEQIEILKESIASLNQTLKYKKTYKKDVKKGVITDKKIGYVIGICRNKYKSFDRVVASKILNNYVELLRNYNYSENEIVIEFDNNVIRRTQEISYWLEWKEFMQDLLENA